MIALLFMGVLLRWLSLWGTLPFSGAAAATLRLAGTLAAFRVGVLRADADAAAGMPDSARVVLRAMAQECAITRAIPERLARLP